MKILHIIDSLGLGGAQTVVKGIFEEQKDNRDIFLFALRKKDICMEVNHPNVKIFNSKRKYSFSAIRELRKIIETERVDVLHCHLFKSQVFGYLLKKKYFPNIKLIFHEHGEIFQRHFIYNLFMKLSRSYVNRYFAVSKATKDKLIETAKISPKNIEVLYNFVDLEKFNKKNIVWDIDKEREKLGIKKDEFVIGFAARIIRRKGWREMLSAVGTLGNSYEDIKLIIAGEGREKNKLLRSIKQKTNIRFVGYCSDMVKFYSLIDCFVIPSHWEPMGITELEAQAMGKVVIASNVPGLNEIVIDEQNGLLFEAKNSADLSNKIKKIYINKKLRKKLVKNGLVSVKQFSLKKYILKLNEVYKKL